jgi:uncharacterized protein
MQMSLGLFLFVLPTVVFQDMKHKRDVRHARNERVGNIDAFQFVGPGEESITLSGNTAYGINHASASYAVLNRMMQTGKAWPLIDGLGNVYGQYIIQSLDISKSGFRKFGQARQSDFTIDLQRVDNPGGSIGNALLDAVNKRLGDPIGMVKDKLSIASLSKVLPIKLPGIGL